MKIGLVKHLNARPLTYGFEKNGNHDLYYDNPSVLIGELIKGNLDLALVSSVECLRNAKLLNYSLSTGVCSKDKVRSILYFERKNHPNLQNQIYVDSGSRSSVALLKILIYDRKSVLPETISTPSSEIQKMILKGEGSHLLFGDHALLAEWDSEMYNVFDLATLWNQSTDLYFCFALWAYPKNKQLPDDLFYSSLEFGLQNIEEIIQNETRFSKEMIREYLQKELHFVLTEKDKLGFQLFQNKCEQLNLI
jgi:chorismate dehydratase